jgi:hypothetical protein
MYDLGWRWELDSDSRPYYAWGGTGPFLNFQFVYWLGPPHYWWTTGSDVYLPDPGAFDAWLVRDGAPPNSIPEPATLTLLTLGASRLWLRRTRQKHQEAADSRSPKEAGDAVAMMAGCPNVAPNNIWCARASGLAARQ